MPTLYYALHPKGPAYKLLQKFRNKVHTPWEIVKAALVRAFPNAADEIDNLERQISQLMIDRDMPPASMWETLCQLGSGLIPPKTIEELIVNFMDEFPKLSEKFRL